MNTKRVGNKTEILVIAEFVRRGIPVLIPFGDAEPYDIVIDVNNLFLRVQIKTANEIRNGVFEVPARLTGHNSRENYSISYKGKADIFATIINGEAHLIRVDEVHHSITLRTIPTSNNQKIGVNFAADYHIDRFLDGT